MQRNTQQDSHHHLHQDTNKVSMVTFYVRQLKELENITYRYCKNLGMVPSTVNCQVIQNDYPERCSNTCTLQNGL